MLLSAVVGFPASLLLFELEPIVGTSEAAGLVLAIAAPILNWGLIGLLLGLLAQALKPTRRAGR